MATDSGRAPHAPTPAPVATAEATPPPSTAPKPWTRRLPAPLRALAQLWWKGVVLIVAGNFLPGLVIALVQQGWNGLVNQLTSWGFLAPAERANPPVFWAAAGVVVLLAVVGFVEEQAERLTKKTKAAAQERKIDEAHVTASAAHTVAQDAGAKAEAAHTTAMTAQATAEQALAAAQARGEAPPPAPLGPPDDRGLLPAAPRFIRREADLAWVMARLRARAISGITALGGLGGIGKTALAAEAVRRLREEEGAFPDGIAVVLCHGLSDPGEVLRRVLARFDPRRAPPRERAADEPGAVYLAALGDAATALLTGKDALVVLDNVEPDLTGVASVVAPLRAAGVAVLLTARQALPAGAVDRGGQPHARSLAVG